MTPAALFDAARLARILYVAADLDGDFWWTNGYVAAKIDEADDRALRWFGIDPYTPGAYKPEDSRRGPALVSIDAALPDLATTLPRFDSSVDAEVTCDQILAGGLPLMVSDPEFVDDLYAVFGIGADLDAPVFLRLEAVEMASTWADPAQMWAIDRISPVRVRDEKRRLVGLVMPKRLTPMP